MIDPDSTTFDISTCLILLLFKKKFFTSYCISDSNSSMLLSQPHWWQNITRCVKGPLVLKSVLEFDPHTAEAGGDHPVFFFQLYSTNFCGLQSGNKFSIFFGTHIFKNHYMTNLRFIFSIVFVKTSQSHLTKSELPWKPKSIILGRNIFWMTCRTLT